MNQLHHRGRKKILLALRSRVAATRDLPIRQSPDLLPGRRAAATLADELQPDWQFVTVELS